VCRTSGPLTEGPGPTSSPGSLPAPRVACRCSPVGFDRQHQASLKMAPFEALYGRKCKTLLYWSEIGEIQLLGPEIIREAERQEQVVRENMKVAQSRQKSYADTR
jgi:hypothetical protein